ncbi:stealth family protein [Streptomyces sp. SM14]|uniref:stealth family protein n=1 Tax=Streptomyces sp. SM14 TaxID=1736045 RepID=UPI0011B09155|nr:stealth family protein [Streptomyces sp. SM14]
MNAPFHAGDQSGPVPGGSLVRRYNKVPLPVRKVINRATPTGARKRAKDWLAGQLTPGERLRHRRARQLRRPLLAADPEVREFLHRGRVLLGREVDGFSAAAAAAHNLRLVVRALDQAGISYFMVPGASSIRHQLGIRLADREAFLVVMDELYAATPLYVGLPQRSGGTTALQFRIDGPLSEELARAGTLRFGEFLIGPRNQLLAHTRSGCDVEFWADGAELLADGDPEEMLPKGLPEDILAESLIAPRRNAVSDFLPRGEQVPALLTVRDHDYPTYQAFTMPRVNEVQFPIDIVYTWVDGDDPAWQRRRDAHRPGSPKGNSAEASRFVSHDELKYSLRSLEMYGDFIRHIYLVTDRQVPEWLNTDAPGLTVVDHSDIFRDPSVLPVFNSHAIETQLHHIEGLSEHYVYFNDDVLLGRPVGPDQFFHANGIAQVPFSSAQFGLGEPHPLEAAPSAAGRNVRRLIWETHKRHITQKFMHVAHPQLKSVMRELEELFPEEFERTAASRFRAVTDVAPGASLHHHQALLTGRAVPGRYRLCYVDISRPEEAELRLGRLLAERGHDFICLNDVATADEDRERVGRLLNWFLDEYFPFPSSFER